MLNRNSIVIRVAIALIAVATIQYSVVAGDHSITFANGSSWRGADGDDVTVVFMENGVEQTIVGKLTKVDGTSPFRFVMVQGRVAGVAASKAILEGDIVSMTSSGESEAKENVGGGRPRPSRPTEIDAPSGDSSEVSESDESRPGVFLLPWEGTVGTMARHDEIEAIAAEADKYGPGQIIVLEINSPGGLVMEGDKIHETLMEVKKRHRVIAWIKKAISAGAFTALHCNEIYFMKVGAMGSAVMFSGETSISGPQLDAWVKDFGDVAESGGRSRIPAECMVTRTRMASYDKDPETGRVTWYPDMRGEFDISNDTQVLTLNAENAMHSGYINGIADTEEDLAEFLDLPEWHEINDSGRRIHQRWKDTLEACQKDVPRIIRDLNIKPEDQQIALMQKLLRWYDRVGEQVMMVEFGSRGLPPKDDLERAIERARRAKARQGRG
jgi:hypothetical protein